MTAETIIIADDHPLFRTAMEQAVRHAFESPRVIMAEDFDTLCRVVAEHNDIDLLLLDLKMPGSRGYSALAYLRHEKPELPVVIVSAFEQQDIIIRAMDHGAAGFIPKTTNMATMAAAMQKILDGEQWFPIDVDNVESDDPQHYAEKLNSLTPQQMRVLMMITDGLLNKQIAAELKISEATVKAHITAILRKLGVYTRTQAALAARNLAIDWKTVAGHDNDVSTETP